MSEEKNIHEAIIGVMKDVGYVQKKRSAGLNYSYAGEAALIEAVRPAMVEHNIYMYVKEISKVNRENYVTAKGTAMANTLVQTIVRFVHAPSETFIDVASIGEGADSGDKSANKASTGEYKYAIRQTFCIETGDDPDQTPSEQVSRVAKPVAKTVATVGTDEDQLNKDFPPVGKPLADVAVEFGGEVVDTVSDEKVEPRYNKEHLMKVQQINAIKELAGVDTPTVIATVNKLEKGHTYTVSDVATIIKQGENK